MMKSRARLAILIAAFGPITARADIVTYDFTGVVTDTSGIYNSVKPGSIVTGTYSFDFAAAIPAESFGTISENFFFLAEFSGADDPYGASPPSNVHVFTSTAQVDGISYRTEPAGPLLNTSVADGSRFDDTFSAAESVQSAVGPGFSSVIDLFDNGVEPFSADGLPDFSNATGTGSFDKDIGGQNAEIEYDITSMIPVSISVPGTLPLAAGGLALLALIQRRLKVTRP